MKINKSELESKVKTILKITDKSAIIKESIVIHEDRIVGYDGLVLIQIPFLCDFSCCIEGDKLINLLQGIEDDTIEINASKEGLLVQSAKTKGQIKVYSDYNIDISNIPNNSVDIPSDLIDAMHLVSFSTSKDITNKAFSCVCVADGIVYATDNFRVSKYTLKEKTGTSFLIPASSINKLVTFNNNYKLSKFCIDEGWIHFISDNSESISCRLFEDYESFPSYKDIESIFDIEGQSLKFPKELKEAVEFTSFILKDVFDLDRTTNITIKKDCIICRCEKNGEWVEKRISYNSDKEVRFVINPNFFSEALDRAFDVVLSDEKILFKTDNFTHIVALEINE